MKATPPRHFFVRTIVHNCDLAECEVVMKWVTVQIFLLLFVPLIGLILPLAALAARTAPALAPALLYLFGLLAFILAVESAATGKIAGFFTLERRRPICRGLDLRCHQLGYATLFAAIAVLASIALSWGFAALGLAPPVTAGFAPALLMAVILAVAAWVVIGQAAIPQKTTRRAPAGMANWP